MIKREGAGLNEPQLVCLLFRALRFLHQQNGVCSAYHSPRAGRWNLQKHSRASSRSCRKPVVLRQKTQPVRFHSQRQMIAESRGQPFVKWGQQILMLAFSRSRVTCSSIKNAHIITAPRHAGTLSGKHRIGVLSGQATRKCLPGFVTTGPPEAVNTRTACSRCHRRFPAHRNKAGPGHTSWSFCRAASSCRRISGCTGSPQPASAQSRYNSVLGKVFYRF